MSVHVLALPDLQEKHVYFVPHPRKTWVKVLVVKVLVVRGKARKILVRDLEEHTELELDPTETAFLPVNASNADDLTTLPYLHEPGILENLEQRANLGQQRPYTRISNVLIAVNPLRLMEAPRVADFVDDLAAATPHPWAVAETAFRQMNLAAKGRSRTTPPTGGDGSSRPNQSIVISGESGAGKTETAKLMLHYLCARAAAAPAAEPAVQAFVTAGARRAGARRRSVVSGRPLAAQAMDSSLVTLDRQLLASTPILEALGNAKTAHNDNSSRFGKFLKLQFVAAPGGEEGLMTKKNKKTTALTTTLRGATIEAYLLERSRVTHQAPGERNYHALYSLVAGAGARDASQLRLSRRASDFKYLQRSGCSTIEGVDDANNYADLRSSFVDCGLGSPRTASKKERDRDSAAYFALMTRCLAATLHLGNVSFDAVVTAQCGDQACAISTTDPLARPALDAAVAALGLDPKDRDLENLLLRRKIQAPSRRASRGASLYSLEHDQATAELVRDAVAMEVYARTFDLAVLKLGDAMSARAATDANDDDEALLSTSIGILDIFGFERLEANGLEQLLINFANESLQMTFNKAVLVAEKELYRAEGLLLTETLPELEMIGDDVLQCVALLAGSSSSSSSSSSARKEPIQNHNHTVFKILDDMTQTGKSDDFVCRELHDKLAGAKRWVPPHPKDVKDSFIVAHYAGHVQYTMGDFVAKNSNRVPDGLDALLANSQLFGADLLEERPSSSGLVERSGPSSSSLSSSSSSAAQGSVFGIAAGRKTLSSVFARQMAELCGLLDSTHCSFVRCIKPNETMALGVFDRGFVQSQLRAQGISQTCEVLKRGLPTRIAYADVQDRYYTRVVELLHELSGVAEPFRSLDARDFTRAVLWALGVPEQAYSMGKTRCFFRTGTIAFLDRLYDVDLEAAEGVALVKRLRFFVARRRWRAAFSKVALARTVLDHWVFLRDRSRLVKVTQRAGRHYLHFGLGKRRREIRRTWRRARFKLFCCRVFLHEFALIHAARVQRERAELEAAAELIDLKPEKRTASVILHEQAERGLIPTVEKLRDDEEQNKNYSNTTTNNNKNNDSDKVVVAFGENSSDFDDDDVSRMDRANSLSSPSSGGGDDLSKARLSATASDASMSKSLDALLCSGAALDLGAMDDRVAAGIRKAIGRLQLAKACLERWRKLKLHRGIEKWRDFATAEENNNNNDDGRKRDDDDDDDDDDPNNKITAVVNLKDEWLKAELRSALVTLRAVVSKASRLQGKDEDLNGDGLIRCLHPDTDDLPQSPDETWSLVFCAAGAASSPKTPVSKKKKKLTTTTRPSRRASTNHFDTLMAESKVNLQKKKKKTKTKTTTTAEGSFLSDDDDEDDDDEDPLGSVAEESTLQQQIALLKKQLAAAGIAAVVLVPLDEARAKMNAAVKRLMNGDMEAEKDVEKYDQIIRMHPDYEREEAEKANKWIADTRSTNLAALEVMRGLVPPDIRTQSLADLLDRGLPEPLIRRLWTKKATWLVRFHPEDIANLHIADLLSKYNNQGLDIVEMRAVWASLPAEFNNDGDGKKNQWKANFRTKLMELFTKEDQHRLSKYERRHPGYDDVRASFFEPNAPLIRAGVTKSNPYAAQEVPVVINVDMSKFAQAEKKNKKNTDENPRIAAACDCATTTGGAPAERRFVVLTNGELRVYRDRSDLALDKAAEATIAVRSEAATVTLDVKGDVLTVSSPAQTIFIHATTPTSPRSSSSSSSFSSLEAGSSSADAWAREIRSELDFIDQKARLKKDREEKRRKAEEDKKNKADDRRAAQRPPAAGGLMAALAGRSSSRGAGGGRIGRGRGGIRGGLGLAESISQRGGGGRGRSGSLLDAISRRSATGGS